MELKSKEAVKLENDSKNLDSDFESSSESDGAQQALLEEIIPSKVKKAPKKRVIPVDEREKDIEKLLFGSSSIFGSEQADSVSESSDEDSLDDGASEESIEEGSDALVLGLKAAEKEKVRISIFALLLIVIWY